MNILHFKVCTVKSNIPSKLGDHILGVVLNLLWSQDYQEDFQAGDWGVIQKDLEDKSKKKNPYLRCSLF
jgi:hypothetical protein